MNDTETGVQVDEEQELKDLERKDTETVKEEKKQARLSREYEDGFDGEEKLVHKLAGVHNKAHITFVPDLEIDDIIMSNVKKSSRSDTLIGLTEIISEWGVMSPIHVMTTEDGDMYQLLEGLRRLFGAIRSGLKTIPAMVWDFPDKQEGKDISNLLSLMLNRSQHFTPAEMWYYMQVLETANEAGPGLIEHLLQMNAGDAMKLKDVMLSDASYEEIRQDLLASNLTIDAAYKKLCNARKKEDKLAKEDQMALKGTADGEEERQHLSVEEVRELLDMGAADVSDTPLEELNMADEALGGPHYQTTDNREPVDKAIKQATLMRDKFRCRCCGKGGHEGWLGVLVYHHAIPVYCDGPDTVENGLTLCQDCHITLHNYAWGHLHVRVDELSPAEKKVFTNIFRYGNLIIKAQQKLKIDPSRIKAENQRSARHMRPGEGLGVNKEAFSMAQSGSASFMKHFEKAPGAPKPGDFPDEE